MRIATLGSTWSSGGATTSPKHTAIKIAPEYEEPTIRVRDASKVAQIVGALMNKEKKKDFSTENHRKQERLRVNFGNKTKDSLLSKEEAYKKRLRLDWKKSIFLFQSRKHSERW